MRRSRVIIAALSLVLVAGVVVEAASSADPLVATRTVTTTTTLYDNVEMLGTCSVIIAYPAYTFPTATTHIISASNYSSSFVTSYYANETTAYVTATTRSLSYAVDYTSCTYAPGLP